MTTRIRRLEAGDEPILAVLAREDAEFDIPGRGGARTPIAPSDAVAYLGDPNVLHWIAEEDATIVGHVLCYVQRRRAGDPRQVMVYEVGVRSGWRRRGIGRQLLAAVDQWMWRQGVSEIWVLADNPGAVGFYEACGFSRDPEQAVQMSRRRPIERA